MKTIEEAAIMYEESKVYKINSGGTKGNVISAFKKGAEFVQRWISIEKELPEFNLHVLVICEFSSGKQDYAVLKRIASRDSAKGWQWSSISSNSFFALKITHWRPIERK